MQHYFSVTFCIAYLVLSSNIYIHLSDSYYLWGKLRMIGAKGHTLFVISVRLKVSLKRFIDHLGQFYGSLLNWVEVLVWPKRIALCDWLPDDIYCYTVCKVCIFSLHLSFTVLIFAHFQRMGTKWMWDKKILPGFATLSLKTQTRVLKFPISDQRQKI